MQGGRNAQYQGEEEGGLKTGKRGEESRKDARDDLEAQREVLDREKK